jgi:phosphonopyruvate decarboxylase
MISCDAFFSALTRGGVGFFTGVPDSLLKDICAYITDQTLPTQHVIAANEGAALALASGAYLATGRPALVYLQNSGLGNLVNPLTSLTDPDVYAIPALLLIGWRGEPGVHDEPQHRKQGRVTLSTLDALEIPHVVLSDENEAAARDVAAALALAQERSAPVALVVRKGTFAPYKLKKVAPDQFALKREDALKRVLEALQDRDVVVSTTGMASREVFEHRVATRAGHGRDFLTVGCMGHSSQIALGIAIAKPERFVCCLDGDGAVLMHLGSLAIVGATRPKNLCHVVINNGAHDSVGGQPTVGFVVDLPAIAAACRYACVRSTSSGAEIPALLAELRSVAGPTLLEIKVAKGSRPDLGRPTTTPVDNKREFMAYLQ